MILVWHRYGLIASGITKMVRFSVGEQRPLKILHATAGEGAGKYVRFADE